MLLFKAVIAGCRFIKIGDIIQSSAVVEFLGALRRDGRSTKAANDYLDAIRGFSRWLWRDKRSALVRLPDYQSWREPMLTFGTRAATWRPTNLAAFSKPPAQVAPHPDADWRGAARPLPDRRRDRFPPQNWQASPEGFNLDCSMTTATVLASCTKSRREAAQPLPLERLEPKVVPSIGNNTEQFPMAHSLAHKQRFRRILADIRGRMMLGHHNAKPLKKPRFPRLFQGLKRLGNKWSRGGSNP